MVQNRSVFSVSQVNEYVRMTLDASAVLSNIWLRGEISNFKNQYSTGHLYMSLKDGSSSIRAVMFKGYAQRLNFPVKDGDKVIVHGKISVYSARGEYQIYIDEMHPDGVGDLAYAFEKLKEKLRGEGLFDQSHKKPLPADPKRVGIITSASGAAVHDMINVSGRRSPNVEIVIYPALVQGADAPRSLIGGVLYFNRESDVDVIIIGRGGGSVEDLWAFNNEDLARTIHASDIPVVSAVGHETDVTICDLVSDLRAPTPSAAAELVFPDEMSRRARCASLQSLMSSRMHRRLTECGGRISMLYARLDAASPARMLEEKSMRLISLVQRMENAEMRVFDSASNRLKLTEVRLCALNPLAVLSKGYALVQKDTGDVVSASSELQTGDRVKLLFADGEKTAIIE